MHLTNIDKLVGTYEESLAKRRPQEEAAWLREWNAGLYSVHEDSTGEYIIIPGRCTHVIGGPHTGDMTIDWWRKLYVKTKPRPRRSWLRRLFFP